MTRTMLIFFYLIAYGKNFNDKKTLNEKYQILYQNLVKSYEDARKINNLCIEWIDDVEKTLEKDGIKIIQ